MDDKAIAAMRTMRVECQLHLPFELDMLEAARAMLPGVPQVACFDTAFHAGQPESATRLPLPDDYWRKGYRRFGFHGLNYQHVAETLAPAPARTIIAHLGAGASLCALQDGKSIATTMGYSTLDGLIMATRPGSLDPGVLLALMKFEGMGHDELECLLYRDSGLKGLSGLSGDMQVLLASSDPRARLAVEIYCQSIARHVAGLTVALGGLDLLAFTGGVGENAAPIRDRVTGLLAHLGKFATRVIAADEERVIAEQTWGLI
jgi:acetate kinase